VGEGFPVPTGQAHYNLLGILGGGGGTGKVIHRSNHMYELKHFGMVWQRRTRERCCGAHREPHF
jgi:hypothetical protein